MMLELMLASDEPDPDPEEDAFTIDANIIESAFNTTLRGRKAAVIFSRTGRKYIVWDDGRVVLRQIKEAIDGF